MNETANSIETGTLVKTIWVSKLADFRKKFAHLNKLLRKSGRPEMVAEYGKPRTVEIPFTFHMKGEPFKFDSHESVGVEVMDVTIKNARTTIKKDDRDFVYIGSVDFTDGRLVFCKDDKYLDRFNKITSSTDICDHCHTRRKRNAYFLFRDEKNGEIVQIGSSCAKDYFGIDCRSFLTAEGQTFFVGYEGDYESFSFDSDEMTVSYKFLYRALNYATRGFTRWVSKERGVDVDSYLLGNSSFDEVATSSIVHAIFANITRGDWNQFGDLSGMDSCGEPVLTNDEVYDYWFQKDVTSFSTNCLEVTRNGYATARTVGIYAYAIYEAVKAKLFAKETASVTANVPCPFPVGSRQNIEGTVVAVNTFEVEDTFSYRGGFITKTVISLKADNDTLYKIFTSGKTFGGEKEGDRITVRGTVGDTKPYKGFDYTCLSRATKIV